MMIRFTLLACNLHHALNPNPLTHSALKGLTTYEYVTLESKRIREKEAEVMARNAGTPDEGAAVEDVIPPVTPPAASSTGVNSGHPRSRAMDHNKRRPSIKSTFTSDNDFCRQTSKQHLDVSLLCGDQPIEKEDSLTPSSLDKEDVGGGVGCEPCMKNETCESDDVIHDDVIALSLSDLKGVEKDVFFLEGEAPTEYYELLKK